MIERMKKITLLVSERGRPRFISKLRALGVLHVRHVKVPEHHEIDFIEDKISKIERMLAVLAPYAKKVRQDSRASSHERNVLGEVEPVMELSREKQDLLSGLDGINKQLQWFDSWGDFDPEDVRELRENGVYLRFYRLDKNEVKKLQQDREYSVIRKAGGYFYVVAVSREEEKGLPFEEVPVPAVSPAKMKQRIDQIDGRVAQIDNSLRTRARGMDAMGRCEKKLKKEHESLTVRFGMREEGKFSYIQGFCPARAVTKISAMAGHHGLGYLIEEADDPDETPTLITNPKWIKIIDPVFKFMNTLPGYEEFDISFYFLIFFSLFFAMLIGDAGYGLVFLLATVFFRWKFRKAPSEPFFLMYVLSVGTIIWGVITGTYFGVEKIAELPLLNMLIVQRINSFAETSQNSIIFLCFVIGAVHLTIAHLMRAVKVINSVRALAQAGWILVLWGMFFAAGKFVLGRPFPPQAGWLLISGMVIVLFFSEPQRGFFKGALVTLANLPLSVISSFSDIVSYLRLFAVGYATVVVASSFNNMAMSVGPDNIIGVAGAAVILFLGHALNIALGFMAVIVHGMRLNMLEFSNHLGMQWSGKKYEPFCE